MIPPKTKNPKIKEMKKWIFLMAMMLLVAVNGISAKTEGGVIEYSGSIGPYKVEFSYMDLHMGDGAHFNYQYTTIRVNKGEWIELTYVKDLNGYSVWEEHINGKKTGTFTIKLTSKSITGRFVNSKGKRFKVNAKRTGGNWADAGEGL